MARVYRRPPRLVAYWRGGDFILHPYLKGSAYVAAPELVGALAPLSRWLSVAEYARASGMSRGVATRWLNWLASHGLVDRVEGPVPAEPVESVWDVWNEAAGFLHFSTRDQPFSRQPAARAQLRVTAAAGPPPPITKTYPGKPRTPLPTVKGRASFEAVLKARRTWRRFSSAPASVADLASVLGSTFRVQRLVDFGLAGTLMLRSSPSGGARHPTEAYVLVRGIKGLPSGFYYYSPTEHALVTLDRRRVARAEITRLLAGQSWYAGASAVVFMTSVFDRKVWVYRTAFAYKSLLLEAGHFCQTFCLAATARRLAPFCTAAFAASAIERVLELDGEQESVMYVAGFGVRPKGMTWAPLPEGEYGLGE